MAWFDCGFAKPSINWPLPGREVPCGICDCLGTIARVIISSPHVVGDGVASVLSVRGLTTAGTFNSAHPYFIALLRKLPATSPHHSWINLTILICVCRKLSLQCGTVWEVVHITQPGSSSSLNLRSSVSSPSSSSSFPSCSLSKLGRLVRLSLIAFNTSSNVVSGFLVVDLDCSAFLTPSCSRIISVSASCSRYLTPAVSLPT